MKILLLLMLSVSTIFVSAQVQIGGNLKKNKSIGIVKRGGALIASLEQSSEDSAIYLLCFKNYEYSLITDIRCIVFGASKKDLQEIKTFFKTCFEKEKGQESTLKLGSSDIMLTSIKTLGFKSLYISVLNPQTSKGFFNITGKEIDKLFENLDQLSE